jgi:hypothetical protein
MKNTERWTLRLVAVGASVAANCRPCLKTTIEAARQDKIKESDIANALEIGKMVRHCAVTGLDALAASLIDTEPSRSFRSVADGDFRCGPRKE